MTTDLSRFTVTFVATDKVETELEAGTARSAVPAGDVGGIFPVGAAIVIIADSATNGDS